MPTFYTSKIGKNACLGTSEVFARRGLGPKRLAAWLAALIALNLPLRGGILLHAMTPPAASALPITSWSASRSGLTAIPSQPATAPSPQDMRPALPRRMRLPSPLRESRCAAPSCEADVDAYDDHALSCPGADSPGGRRP